MEFQLLLAELRKMGFEFKAEGAFKWLIRRPDNLVDYGVLMSSSKQLLHRPHMMLLRFGNLKGNKLNHWICYDKGKWCVFGDTSDDWSVAIHKEVQYDDLSNFIATCIV